MANEAPNSDLALSPWTYMYLSNVAQSGIVTAFVGPMIVNQTGQDKPTRYNEKTQAFEFCSTLEAVKPFIRANEGEYIVLQNPCESADAKLSPNSKTPMTPLLVGRRVNISGPLCQPLWPGQSATVIPGHVLSNKDYLVARIYNSDEAKKNWSNSTVVVQEGDTKATNGLPTPDNFAVGNRIIISGKDVSFYIPCTGVEVLKINGNYVQEAVTLEQMEYCCLIGEDGSREYPKGPATIFPSPTQRFDVDENGSMKFKPIELSEIDGLHVQVTADFEGEDLESTEVPRPIRKYVEGEELFITGKSLSIFYPMQTLTVIKNGSNFKYSATVVPKGEGRYVANKETGDITTVRGPVIFLPDPRKEFLVHRIIPQGKCELWYPGNQKAKEFNQQLEALNAKSSSANLVSSYASDSTTMRGLVSSSSLADYSGPSSVRKSGNQAKPVILDSKFEGVPRISVWPGYSVLIVGSMGDRRVVEGPQVVLLDYDENLGDMQLSTGKPKSTDKLMTTSYLCVKNNKVGDVIPFESKDNVSGTIKLSLCVDFEPKYLEDGTEDKTLWFDVDNYVKFLTDHVRSLIAGMAKKNTVSDIKANYVELIRDTILGPKVDGKGREGLHFPANGMRIKEVEVLGIWLSNKSISDMLDNFQFEVVSANIEIDNAKKVAEKTAAQTAIQLETEKVKNEFAKQKAQMVADLSLLQGELEREALRTKMAQAEVELELALVRFKKTRHDAEAAQELLDIQSKAEITRDLNSAELDNKIAIMKHTEDLKMLTANTESAVKRFEAAKDGLTEVVLSMHRDDMVAKLSAGNAMERLVSGESVESSLASILPISSVLGKFLNETLSKSIDK